MGLGLIGLLILLPSARRDSFYEVSDALLVMGVPLLVIGTAIGAMAGGLMGRSHGDFASPPTRRSTVTLVGVTLVGCVLALWLFLRASGLLNVLP